MRGPVVRRERAERARGADLAAWLRSSGGREQTLVADVLTALVRAAVIDEQDQARGIDALIEAGILSPGQPPAAVLRRRDQSL